MSFSLAAHFYNEIFEDWMLADNQYNEYERFLGLFDFKVDGHITPGGSKMNYYEDYRYPVAVDPKKHFIDFVYSCVENLPIQNVRPVSSWWIDYPHGTYSTMHSHEQTQRFSVICNLTPYFHDNQRPHAGHLFATPAKLKHIDFTPEAGDVVILDGRIHHGTYPNIHERKVFCMDWEYEFVDNIDQNAGGSFKG